MPGLLTKARGGQQRAEVTATGTTGTPHSMASRVPPLRYLPCWPRATRVPSGKMTTHMPCASRRRPCVTMRVKASVGRPRSMRTMFSRASTQPKKGMRASSRLKT